MPLQCQFGFTSKRGTLHPILGLKMHMREAGRQGKRLFVAFIDVASAYYTVDRSLMIQALRAYGVGKNIGAWMDCLFAQERLAVVLQGRHGIAFKGQRGLRAGDCASPILFNLVLDTAIRKLRTAGVRLYFYADDGAIIAETPEALQEGLNRLRDELGYIGLRLSVDKSKLMCFRPPKLSIHISDAAYAAAFRQEEVAGYVPARQRGKQKVACPKCGKSVSKSSLSEHLRTKSCRKASTGVANNPNETGEHQAEQAVEEEAAAVAEHTTVARGAHGRVVVAMGTEADQAHPCPFQCSFHASGRDAMTAHLRHRHLEQPVYPFVGNQKVQPERQCPLCGWVVAACRFKQHFQSLKCRVLAQRKEMAELERERLQPLPTITINGEPAECQELQVPRSRVLGRLSRWRSSGTADEGGLATVERVTSSTRDKNEAAASFDHCESRCRNGIALRVRNLDADSADRKAAAGISELDTASGARERETF